MVYRAVATQEGLRGWWTADSSAEPRVGSVARFGFGRAGAGFEMRIDVLEPGRHVEWSCLGHDDEWRGTRLVWTLEPAVGGSTRLRFVHGGWRAPDGWFGVCNSTWGELMYRLKAYAETGRPNPHWTP